MNISCSFRGCGASDRFTRTCTECPNKVCLSHNGKRYNFCIYGQLTTDQAPSDPPCLPIVDGLALNKTDAHVEHRVETAQDFLVIVQEAESDDDDETVQNSLPVDILREPNGMPTMGYDDSQISLINSIAELRVYFKASRRGTEPAVKARWELVATDFFSASTKLKPLQKGLYCFLPQLL